MKKVKEWVPIVLVVFFAYAIVTAPDKAASMVTSTWDIVATSVGNIGRFANRILNG